MNFPIEGAWVPIEISRDVHFGAEMRLIDIMSAAGRFGYIGKPSPKLQTVRIVPYPESRWGRFRFWLAGIR